MTKRILLLAAVAAVGIGIVLAGAAMAPKGLRDAVTPDEAAVVLTECAEDGDAAAYLSCVRVYAEDKIPADGPGAFAHALDTVYAEGRAPALEVGSPQCPSYLWDEDNPEARCQCHYVAHVAGEVAIEQGRSLGETIAACGSACGYGCVHGATLAEVRTEPTLLNDADRLTAICTEADLSHEEYLSCVHGIGHALAELRGFDIRAAFPGCEVFSDVNDRTECALGVAMETYGYQDGKKLRSFTLDELERYCLLEQTISAPERCMMRVAVDRFFVLGKDAEEGPEIAWQICQKTGDMRELCAAGLGMAAGWSNTFSETPDAVISACAHGTEAERSTCLQGAAAVARPLNPKRMTWLEALCVAEQSAIGEDVCTL